MLTVNINNEMCHCDTVIRILHNLASLPYVMQTAVFFQLLFRWSIQIPHGAFYKEKNQPMMSQFVKKGPDPKTARQAGRRNKNPPKLKKNVHEVYTGIELGGHTGLQTPGTKLTA